MAAGNRRDPSVGGVPGAENANARHGAAILAPVTARGEATRRRLLDAAEEVFGELGYYEASVSEITRRAGVAQGTFYIYFRSKRETFIELVEDIGNRLRAATTAAIEGAPDRLEAERRGFAAFVQFVAGHRRIYRIVEEAGRVAPETAREYYRRISLGYERGLRTAMAGHEIRQTDVEAIAYALMGIAHFLALRWLIWPAESSTSHYPPKSDESTAGAPTAELPPAVYNAAMDFIARGLSPAPTAPK
jgi:AcrR family transcriptional regulator